MREILPKIKSILVFQTDLLWLGAFAPESLPVETHSVIAPAIQ